MSTLILVALITFVLLLVVHAVLDNLEYRSRMRSLAARRSGESICHFARSLPYRQLHRSVIRQVYGAIQSEVAVPDCRVPIRTTDHCIDTLEIDPEDFLYLVANVADRCGRSLDDVEKNPFYDRIHTAGLLVQLLCAQPTTR